MILELERRDTRVLHQSTQAVCLLDRPVDDRAKLEEIRAIQCNAHRLGPPVAGPGLELEHLDDHSSGRRLIGAGVEERAKVGEDARCLKVPIVLGQDLMSVGGGSKRTCGRQPSGDVDHAFEIDMDIVRHIAIERFAQELGDLSGIEMPGFCRESQERHDDLVDGIERRSCLHRLSSQRIDREIRPQSFEGGDQLRSLTLVDLTQTGQRPAL